MLRILAWVGRLLKGLELRRSGFRHAGIVCFVLWVWDLAVRVRGVAPTRWIKYRGPRSPVPAGSVFSATNESADVDEEQIRGPEPASGSGGPDAAAMSISP